MDPEIAKQNEEWCGENSKVCELRPKDYSYYDAMNIQWGDMANYECYHKIGRGKYSEVYLGVCKANNVRSVIKVLKPVKAEKIYREIKILQILYGGPNIVGLMDILKDKVTRLPCFVYEYLDCTDGRGLFSKLSDTDCRIYIYKILQALEYSHSHGIMHRDVKPLNIIVNTEDKELRLIDWGLAEFYHSDKDYNVRVASRYYKGPELLVDDRCYHYSLDIWSLGCTMAGMIFKKDTMFKGKDNDDQLIKVMDVMGDEDLHTYVQKYNLKIPKATKKLMRGKDFEKQPWENFINEKNQENCGADALDLLDKMLVYDKNNRIKCKDAMAHKYFDPIRKFIAEQEGKKQELLEPLE